jgi:RNA polymerase sigma-70 factor (ECF subfamily)
LVRRLRRRDGNACRELIRRHHRVVYGYLRRLGADEASADDLTQETYAKAWQRIESLREAASLRSWLLTIARNQFLQSVRRANPGVEELDAAMDRASEEPGAEAAVSAGERDERLHRAMGRLDSTLRETVGLHYFHELSLREVGAVLGIPTGTVKSRLNRALEALRGLLEREVDNHGQEGTGKAVTGRA